MLLGLGALQSDEFGFDSVLSALKIRESFLGAGSLFSDNQVSDSAKRDVHHGRAYNAHDTSSPNDIVWMLELRGLNFVRAL